MSNDFTEFLRERDDAARAYVTGDPGPVDAMTTDTDPATFFGPDGSVVSGAEAVHTAFAAGGEMFAPGGDSSLEVLQSHESGDLAFWCGVQHATVTMASDGSQTTMPLRITEVFRREDGAWRLVHRMADPLRSAGSA